MLINRRIRSVFLAGRQHSETLFITPEESHYVVNIPTFDQFSERGVKTVSYQQPHKSMWLFSMSTLIYGDILHCICAFMARAAGIAY